MFNACVVIPVYNHEGAIGTVLDGVLCQPALHCFLVDDGSDTPCAQALDTLARTHAARVTLVRAPANEGKGAAVLRGLHAAAAAGFTHAVQIDADGQHDIADLARFIALAEANPRAVIAGCPVYDESVPKARLYARYLTHVWVWINTLSFAIRDSMCGFRVYPLASVLHLAARQRLGTRMNFDTDILVRLYWDGVDVVNLPTRVHYPIDGVSHFRLWRDNLLITGMHTALFFGMLRRLPSLLVRKRSAA